MSAGEIFLSKHHCTKKEVNTGKSRDGKETYFPRFSTAITEASTKSPEGKGQLPRVGGNGIMHEHYSIIQKNLHLFTTLSLQESRTENLTSK